MRNVRESTPPPHAHRIDFHSRRGLAVFSRQKILTSAYYKPPKLEIIRMDLWYARKKIPFYCHLPPPPALPLSESIWALARRHVTLHLVDGPKERERKRKREKQRNERRLEQQRINEIQRERGERRVEDLCLFQLYIFLHFLNFVTLHHRLLYITLDCYTYKARMVKCNARTVIFNWAQLDIPCLLIRSDSVNIYILK